MNLLNVRLKQKILQEALAVNHVQNLRVLRILMLTCKEFLNIAYKLKLKISLDPENHMKGFKIQRFSVVSIWVHFPLDLQDNLDSGLQIFWSLWLSNVAAKASQLEEFIAERTFIPSSVLECLAPSLKRLALETILDDSSMQLISTLPHIEHLEFECGDHVTDNGILALTSLPLEMIRIVMCSRRMTVSPAALSQLINSFPHLKRLYVFGLWTGKLQITENLANLVSLEIVVACHWTEEALFNIIRHCQSLLRLRLEGICNDFDIPLNAYNVFREQLLSQGISDVLVQVVLDDRYHIHSFIYPTFRKIPHFLLSVN